MKHFFKYFAFALGLAFVLNVAYAGYLEMGGSSRVVTQDVVDTATITSNTNVQVNRVVWHRDGRFQIGEAVVKWNGAGGGGAVTWTWALPDSCHIDFDWTADQGQESQQQSSVLAWGKLWNQGVAIPEIVGIAQSETTLSFHDNNGLVLANVFGADDAMKFQYRVPCIEYR